MASTLATHFDKPYVDNPDHVDLRPSFLVLVYPVISMDAKITHMDSRKALLGNAPSESQTRFFSNELHVTKPGVAVKARSSPSCATGVQTTRAQRQ